MLAVLIAGFLLTIALVLVLRPVASRVGLVDRPGGRKTHTGEVPVIGGIAMHLGFLVTAIIFVDTLPQHAVLFLSGALMVAVGALDDRFDVPPRWRMVAHLVAAVLLVMATGFRVESLGNLLGFGDIHLGPFDFVFTVVAAVALINAFNMLDGVDGIAGGVGLVALAGLSFQLLPVGDDIAIFTLASIGAIVGFLVFNLPAQFNRRWLTFMGDAGSALMGFVLAGLALIAIQARPVDGQVVEALPPVVVLWLLPIPIVELFTSTIRRAATGRSPLQPDRGHFHHRLLDGGFTVRAVFLLYMVASAVSAAAGLWMWRAGAGEPVMFLVFFAVSVLWLLGTHNVERIVALLPAQLRRGDWAPPLPPSRTR